MTTYTDPPWSLFVGDNFNVAGKILSSQKLKQIMASSDMDVASLTPEQQSALEQYMSFTSQELEAAVPLLQRSQWNVQV
jgi:UBA-like domain